MRRNKKNSSSFPSLKSTFCSAARSIEHLPFLLLISLFAPEIPATAQDVVFHRALGDNFELVVFHRCAFGRRERLNLPSGHWWCDNDSSLRKLAPGDCIAPCNATLYRQSSACSASPSLISQISPTKILIGGFGSLCSISFAGKTILVAHDSGSTHWKVGRVCGLLFTTKQFSSGVIKKQDFERALFKVQVRFDA